MKIALYGGSFDPPHIGHLLVASMILATEDVDELWLIPTHTHVDGKILTDYEHRITMTRLLARQIGLGASVSRVEQRLARAPGFRGSYTIDMVCHVVAEFPHDQFRFVIGSDLLGKFDTWDGAAEIRRLAPLIVVDRAGYEAPSEPIGQLVVPDVSSTLVRDELRRDSSSVLRLVPRDVLRHIVLNRLY